jgi:hypothetical protein
MDCRFVGFDDLETVTESLAPWFRGAERPFPGFSINQIDTEVGVWLIPASVLLKLCDFHDRRRWGNSRQFGVYQGKSVHSLSVVDIKINKTDKNS